LWQVARQGGKLATTESNGVGEAVCSGRMSVLFKTLPEQRATLVDMSETELRALPNVGPKIAQKLLRLGIERPDDLRGRDPEQLFQRLGDLDGRRHDPCVLDTFSAIVDIANGAPARPWWFYSRERKARALAEER
jgi:hypothetical protein